jgi:hypothetical protein
MTPSLKQQMEEKWDAPGCRFPLRPARWKLVFGRLSPDYDSDVADQDESDPLLAE